MGSERLADVDLGAGREEPGLVDRRRDDLAWAVADYDDLGHALPVEERGQGAKGAWGQGQAPPGHHLGLAVGEADHYEAVVGVEADEVGHGGQDVGGTAEGEARPWLRLLPQVFRLPLLLGGFEGGVGGIGGDGGIEEIGEVGEIREIGLGGGGVGRIAC
ncbi:hypothetical protein GCM10022419_077800 [Nonomuraea rosea]|uniref:Uncharacterized protein n=1 Tax=Nonomuraea rosea TaxID=638574 RepID=A0ABP6YIJ8_9ACTN